MLGRRGPAQAAFTNPEVRELGELTDADIVIDPAEMELDDASRAYVESEDCDPTHRRNVEIFTEFSQRAPEGKPKRVVMRFCCSPVEIRGEGRVESIVVGRNELYRDESGAIRARDTGEREEIECGLVLRSIGYKGIGLEGIPFDAGRGLIPNESGRVTDPETRRAGPRPLRGRLDQARPVRRDRDQQEGRPRHRQHAARGPRGGPGPRARARRAESIEELLDRARRRPRDLHGLAGDRPRRGQAAGEPHGRPRVKFCRVHEMVEAARRRDTGGRLALDGRPGGDRGD